MDSLKYQLKNIRRDKMCILTFLLPIIIGIAIHFLSGISFRDIGETSFGGLKNNLSEEAVLWLEQNGTYTEYETLEELKIAVNEPSTQMIGVLENDDGIHTLLSGDELEVNEMIGNTLPSLYKNRENIAGFKTTLIPLKTENSGIKSILIAITLVTAMFMGCTFNAMNIIGEKEDGIWFINQILPMSMMTYIIQKTSLGFIGGFTSTVITALVCIRLNLLQIIPFIIIIMLSNYISAVIGLYIGSHSEGLMIGIVYIKMTMILFLAPPILVYMTVSQNSLLFYLSYILPSSASFYALMDVMNGRSKDLWIAIIILFFHAVLWSSVYLILETKFRKNIAKKILDISWIFSIK